MTTPPEPTLRLRDAPPSNCNTHCSAFNNMLSTPPRVSGILRMVSTCSIWGVSASGKGSCLSLTSTSASTKAHGFWPATHRTLYYCMSTTNARSRIWAAGSATRTASACVATTTCMSRAKVVYRLSRLSAHTTRQTSYVSSPYLCSVRLKRRPTKATGAPPYKHATKPASPTTEGYMTKDP